MILILTHSNDELVNMVMPLFVGRTEVFRFNLDRWREYSWNISPQGYEIENRAGEVCSESGVKSVWVHDMKFAPERVDMPLGGNAETWNREAVLKTCRAICELAAERGKLVFAAQALLVAWSPLRQLRAASAWFAIPQTEVLYRCAPAIPKPVLSKSLCSGWAYSPAINKTARIEPDMVNIDDQWYLQQEVEADEQLCVYCIAGKLLAFRCSLKTSNRYSACSLGEADATAVRELVDHAGLEFAVIKLLRKKRKSVFLEWSELPGVLCWKTQVAAKSVLQAIADAVLLKN